MIKEKTFEITATTFHGMEDLLLNEFVALGIENAEKGLRLVKCVGSAKDLYKLNFHLRTALRVLVTVDEFRAQSDEKLYNSILSINWLDYLNTRKTFTVDSEVDSKFFGQMAAVSLKVKEGIANRFRKDLGASPETDPIDPDVRINVRINGDNCVVSLDSSGDPLYKRGYRTGLHPAQLNECLAAGLILRSDWNHIDAFIDPMCGSGTIPIEAALIAYNIPPGIFRPKFGFERWSSFNKKLFAQIVDEADDEVKVSPAIYGADVNAKYTRLAIDNARNASLGKKISMLNISFEDLEALKEKGVMIINPPYGERLKELGTEDFYKLIGDQLKERFTDFSVWVYSSSEDAMSNIGLESAESYTMHNGMEECKFVKFNLASVKKKKATPKE